MAPPGADTRPWQVGLRTVVRTVASRVVCMQTESRHQHFEQGKRLGVGYGRCADFVVLPGPLMGEQ